MFKRIEMRLKKNHLKTVIGLVLLPIMTVTFLIDRTFLVFLPWVEGVSIQKYVFDRKHIGNSLYRVVIGLILFVIIRIFL